MSFNLVVGDLEPDMAINVTNAGAAVDLTSALALNLRWLKPDGLVVTVPLVAVDLPTGKLKRVWQAGDSDIVGVHRGQVVITTSNNEQTTYPNDGSVIIWWVNSAL